MSRMRALLPLPPGEGWGEGTNCEAFSSQQAGFQRRPSRNLSRRERSQNALALLTLLVIGMFLVGCRTASVPQSVTSTLDRADPDATIEFWHQLGDKPVTCYDDAFHGL